VLTTGSRNEGDVIHFCRVFRQPWNRPCTS